MQEVTRMAHSEASQLTTHQGFQQMDGTKPPLVACTGFGLETSFVEKMNNLLGQQFISGCDVCMKAGMYQIHNNNNKDNDKKNNSVNDYIVNNDLQLIKNNKELSFKY